MIDYWQFCLDQHHSLPSYGPERDPPGIVRLVQKCHITVPKARRALSCGWEGTSRKELKNQTALSTVWPDSGTDLVGNGCKGQERQHKSPGV